MARGWTAVLATGAWLVALSSFGAEPDAAAQREFFEARIRPILVQQCYECHNSADSKQGGLTVDDRRGMLQGGDGGAIIVPGQPGASRLIAILRHEVRNLEMPQGAAKLSDAVIADFERWIADGAFDPREAPPSDSDRAQLNNWDAVFQKRKQWWSFQPIQSPPIPEGPGGNWPNAAIDRFITAKLVDNGLTASPAADTAALVRRVWVALTGLPPTAEEIQTWTARLQKTSDQSGAGPERLGPLVDELLSRPSFAEHWARHWMDWVRYAETHGSEGDPTIDNSWLYRDYLIRALDADVPLDQLVREHLAGDLLESPRLNQALGSNESAIGPASLRMVFHGFAPTDALDEKVRFVDDEIAAITKAFLGLTVSCARCHDHKFDAISQQDYYALFGVLGSARPARTVVDAPSRQLAHREELLAMKPRIRQALASSWRKRAADWRTVVQQRFAAEAKAEPGPEVFIPLDELRRQAPRADAFGPAWERFRSTWLAQRTQPGDPLSADRTDAVAHWRLNDPAQVREWTAVGVGLKDGVRPAGDFAVAVEGPTALAGIYPSGVYSHLVSTKHPARFLSPDIPLDSKTDVWVLARGMGGASWRYVVQDYPREGLIYPNVTLPGEWRWQKLDATYWQGDDIHLELATAQDIPLLNKPINRSWFGIRAAMVVPHDAPAPVDRREFLAPLLEPETTVTNAAQLAERYATALQSAIDAWGQGKANDAQAAFLAAALDGGLLTNQLADLADVQPLIDEYRRLEAGIPVPTRVPGLDEVPGTDQPLFARGDHKRPKDRVPRRFLEAVDATPYATTGTGRRQLAEDFVRLDNPFTRRVLVNRVWHHLFGRGIVPTPDNLGRLGQPPTHPELLDYLATRFAQQGWSMKRLIREIVLTQTWQASSRPTPLAASRDPENNLLSHAFVRRLEAESIRDGLLLVSGELNPASFGPPVDATQHRRSLYLPVRRNQLDPFLRAFDFPEPLSAVGRRDATNVPAQSLMMLNDPTVQGWAERWATRITSDPQLTTDRQRIERMFLAAFGRAPSPRELSLVEQRMQSVASDLRERIEQAAALGRAAQQQQRIIDGIADAARKKLTASTPVVLPTTPVPAPIARWEFASDFRDTVGSAHGEPQQGARVEQGQLVVDGRGYVVTAPIARPLSTKTLEAWVRLDTLDQSGGGVMSVQTPDGSQFDAIVFGERDPRQWVAGSDGFTRTQGFNAPQESEALERTVHLAIVYQADGTVQGYRDGVPYGTAYRSNGPLSFMPGQAVVTFGLRHLPAIGNRFLSAHIERAQLYDRPLTGKEVAASGLSGPRPLGRKAWLAVLDDDQQQALFAAEAEQRRLEQQRQELGAVPEKLESRAVWTDLARSLWLMQEFLYVR